MLENIRFFSRKGENTFRIVGTIRLEMFEGNK